MSTVDESGIIALNPGGETGGNVVVKSPNWQSGPVYVKFVTVGDSRAVIASTSKPLVAAIASAVESASSKFAEARESNALATINIELAIVGEDVLVRKVTRKGVGDGS